uniref:NPC intracellular cholesterol transporter 2 n=1 Tax=Ciona intestinalis TaxID=7719 RepID=F6TKD8_CIOIN
MKSLALFAALLVLGECAITYKDCGSVAGKITGITVSNCTTSPCQLKKGGNYTVNVTFATKEASDNAFAYVKGILDGIAVPFPLPNPDACMDPNSQIKCPLKNNQTYLYSATLPVSKEYPDVKVVVKWELQDAKTNGNDLFCFETPIVVVG